MSILPINGTKDSYQKDVENAKKNFFSYLTFLSIERNKHLLYKHFLMPFERMVSNSGLDGFKKEKFGPIYTNALENVIGTTGNDDLMKIIIQKICISPFGIFEDFIKIYTPDIFIVKGKISITSQIYDGAMDDIIIPPELMNIYNETVNRFVILCVYSSLMDKTKFDKTNAILDFSLNEIRFNIVHNSLNAGGEDSPIITMRKQLVRNEKDDISLSALSENYINSVSSKNQKVINVINHLAKDGSYIVFGETGSGKTTLMRYMGLYKIEEKRNLVTIEDTAELHLPINIAYLTNSKFCIKDLFKVTLRENPSHLLIGETRSEEIVDILESSLVFRVGTTLHADSFEKVIMRINFLIKGAENDYSTEDVYSLITAGIDGFIYMKNKQIVNVWKRKEKIENLKDVLTNYELVV